MEQATIAAKATTQDRQPGIEGEMQPRPEFIKEDYKPAGKLEGKVALVTGGDSGIGRAVSVHFAREGADIAIVYLDEEDDAHETKRLVEATGHKCLLLPGDVKVEAFCKNAVQLTVKEYGKLNILVNNAGMQVPQKDIKDITSEQLTTTFTRSLATNLAGKKIRVNAVAPGPVWTPLIVSTFEEEKIKNFGKETAMKRPGQPSELGPAYVFLASDDASFITGQVLHVNGGEVVNG